tara:strand:- start:1339 stop:1719 length:381 start_codon:yes stop_codon:yes gene_type:complete
MTNLMKNAKSEFTSSLNPYHAWFCDAIVSEKLGRDQAYLVAYTFMRLSSMNQFWTKGNLNSWKDKAGLINPNEGKIMGVVQSDDRIMIITEMMMNDLAAKDKRNKKSRAKNRRSSSSMRSAWYFSR